MRDVVERLDALCDAVPFHASWYLKDVATGARADRHGDVPVPSASTRKVSIMMAALAAVHAGKLALDQRITVEARYQNNDSGTFQHLTPAVAAATGYEGGAQDGHRRARLHGRRRSLQGRPPAVHPDRLHRPRAGGAARRHAGLRRRGAADRADGTLLLRRSRGTLRGRQGRPRRSRRKRSTRAMRLVSVSSPRRESSSRAVARGTAGASSRESRRPPAVASHAASARSWGAACDAGPRRRECDEPAQRPHRRRSALPSPRRWASRVTSAAAPAACDTW